MLLVFVFLMTLAGVLAFKDIYSLVNSCPVSEVKDNRWRCSEGLDWNWVNDEVGGELKGSRILVCEEGGERKYFVIQTSTP